MGTGTGINCKICGSQLDYEIEGDNTYTRICGKCNRIIKVQEYLKNGDDEDEDEDY